MEFGDVIWIFVWFLAGLITFKVTSLKGFLTFVSAVATAFSVLALAFNPGDLIQWISHYPVDYIGGALSNLAYLIGANLVRGEQFHTETLWLRIFFYALGMAVLLVALKVYGPFQIA